MATKFVIQAKRGNGEVAYFVGPSSDEAYNKRLFTLELSDAKLYDSMGHAFTTSKKLSKRYTTEQRKLIDDVRVIEVELTVRATGGLVVPKPEGVKNGDQSSYWVLTPQEPVPVSDVDYTSTNPVLENEDEAVRP